MRLLIPFVMAVTGGVFANRAFEAKRLRGGTDSEGKGPFVWFVWVSLAMYLAALFTRVPQVAVLPFQAVLGSVMRVKGFPLIPKRSSV
jgi:hypothetical protein